MQPIGVLFVCAGNICRSPMAEAVFRRLVHDAGLDAQFEIDSAGTGGWHVGERPDPRTLALLERYAIDAGDGCARQLRPADLQHYDYIAAMDAVNMADIRLLRQQARGKLSLLLDYAPATRGRDVPDPYYDDSFERVYQLVTVGCQGLLAQIRSEHPALNAKR